MLRLKRPLDPGEIEFCYEYWSPLAESNVGKTGAFFTPQDLAYELQLWSAESGHVLDLGAGIGMLSWQVLAGSGYPQDLHLTCLEINPAYVEVGRKLLPEATWICGDVFNLDTLLAIYRPAGYTCVISNPPFGKLPTTQAAKWFSFKGPGHLMAMEVAIRMGQKAVMIAPEVDLPWREQGVPFHTVKDNPSTSWRKWHKLFPDVEVNSCSIDTSAYEWQGASPKVELFQLEVDDMNLDHLPYGLPEEIAL